MASPDSQKSLGVEGRDAPRTHEYSFLPSTLPHHLARMSEVAQGELVTVTEHQSSPIAGETKAQKGKKLAVMRTQTT